MRSSQRFVFDLKKMAGCLLAAVSFKERFYASGAFTKEECIHVFLLKWRVSGAVSGSRTGGPAAHCLNFPC